MYLLYQLGNVQLWDSLKGVGGKGVSINLETQWKSPDTQFPGVGGRQSYLPMTRSILDDPDIVIDGSVTATPHSSIDQTISRIQSFSGRRNIPIIIYQLEDRTPEEATTDISIRWLINYGIVTKVSQKSSYNDSATDFDSGAISVTMKLQRYWQALSPWHWEYRSGNQPIIDPASVINAQQSFDKLFNIPQTFGELVPHSFFYRWQNELSTYNTAYWAKRFDGREGGEGFDFREMGTIEFYSPPELWNGPPSPAYAFTNLEDTGILKITARRFTGLFQSDFLYEDSTLDLEALDAALFTAGLDGLLKTDIVFTGLLDPVPGFVYRENARLTVPVPEWAYSGLYPGELSPGYNEIQISVEESDGLMAALFTFGKV